MEIEEKIKKYINKIYVRDEEDEFYQGWNYALDCILDEIEEIEKNGN